MSEGTNRSFYHFVVDFRIQKERVGEREKDLEELQEKLAERVSCSFI